MEAFDLNGVRVSLLETPVLATFVLTCEALDVGPSAERLTALLRLPPEMFEAMVKEAAASKRAHEVATL